VLDGAELAALRVVQTHGDPLAFAKRHVDEVTPHADGADRHAVAAACVIKALGLPGGGGRRAAGGARLGDLDAQRVGPGGGGDAQRALVGAADQRPQRLRPKLAEARPREPLAAPAFGEVAGEGQALAQAVGVDGQQRVAGVGGEQHLSRGAGAGHDVAEGEGQLGVGVAREQGVLAGLNRGEEVFFNGRARGLHGFAGRRGRG